MDKNSISAYLSDGADARISVDIDKVTQVGEELSSIFSKGGKLLLMGNGGSASDAQHIAAEFVGRFEMERRPLPAMALNVNTSSITAISNDYSYDVIFERQVRAFASDNDMLIGISTSGNSINVLNALKAGKEIGCYCVSLTGSNPGKMHDVSDTNIKVQSSRTSIIQEVHIALGHIWSKMVEDILFTDNKHQE